MHRHTLGDLADHCREHRQMAFLPGPRQVGKTMVAKLLGEQFSLNCYYNWDNQSHRELILKGPEAVAEHAGLKHLQASAPLCAFDEIRKYRHWRNFL